MTWLASFDTTLCVRLILTLGHFLWQGAAIFVLVLAVSRLMRRASANARYGLFVTALLMMAACPPVTFWLIREVPPASAVLDTTPAPPVAVTVSERVPGDVPRISEPVSLPPVIGVTVEEATSWESYAPHLVAVYLIGSGLMLARLLLAMYGGRRLRRRSTPVEDPVLLSALGRQARLLGLRFTPAIAYCEQVMVPTIIGVLRPMVLLPLSLASGMTPQQVESLLAHELAHIRRHDHVLILVQRVIEAVLFFHPAVWWLSRCIRIERENCCDDLVVIAGGQRLVYAESLLRVAEMVQWRSGTNQLAAAVALGVADRPSQLRLRITRLLAGPEHQRVRLAKGWGVMVSVTVLAVLATVVGVAESGNGGTASPADRPPVIQPSAIQPVQSSPSDRTKTNRGESLRVTKSYDVDPPVEEVAKHLNEALVALWGVSNAPAVKAFPFARQIVVTGQADQFRVVDDWISSMKKLNKVLGQSGAGTLRPLRPGDRLRIRAVDFLQMGVESELNQVVDENGVVYLPSIGKIAAKGLTTSALRDRIIEAAKAHKIYSQDAIPSVFVDLLDGRDITATVDAKLGKTTSSPSISQQSSGGESLKATLPNHATVELLGVSTYPVANGSWWCGDGSSQVKAPYRAFDASLAPDTPAAYVFAVRIIGADSASRKCALSDTRAATSSGRPKGADGQSMENMFAIVGLFTKEHDSQVDLRIGISDGLPTVAGAFDASRMIPVEYPDGGVIFHKPYEEGGSLIVVASYTDHEPYRESYLVAYDSDGKAHRATSFTMAKTSGLISSRCVFEELNLARLKRIELKTQAYLWVVFKNVSLESGRRTAATAVIDAKPGRMPARKAEPRRSRASAKPQEKLDATIVIDAGHGGSDPGAQGDSDTLEKTIALDLSRALERELAGRVSRVVMTRSSDEFIELAERAAIADREEADLLISIHLDARRRPESNGVSLCLRSDNTSEKESKGIAYRIQAALTGNDIPFNGIVRTRFQILQGHSRPAILLELGSMTNAGDVERLRDDAYRAKLAGIIAEGIVDGVRTVKSENAGTLSASDTSSATRPAAATRPSSERRVRGGSARVTKSYEVDLPAEEVAKRLNEVLVASWGVSDAPVVKAFPFARQIVVTGQADQFRVVEDWLSLMKKSDEVRRLSGTDTLRPLRRGDQLRIRAADFLESDVESELNQIVDEHGVVYLPSIGGIKAEGLTTSALRDKIIEAAKARKIYPRGAVPSVLVDRLDERESTESAGRESKRRPTPYGKSVTTQPTTAR